MNLSEYNQFLITDNINKEGEGISKLTSRFSNYLIIFFLISLLNILYLGGWQKLFMISGNIMIGIKFYAVFIVVVLLERSISTVSGMNKLINLNYKLLLPLSVLNLAVTVVFFILRNVYFII
jgi:NADH:ubiquinone oxidoreductase subunit H